MNAFPRFLLEETRINARKLGGREVEKKLILFGNADFSINELEFKTENFHHDVELTFTIELHLQKSFSQKLVHFLKYGRS